MWVFVMDRSVPEKIDKLIVLCRERGSITVDELDKALPADDITSQETERSCLGFQVSVSISSIPKTPLQNQRFR